MRFRRRLGSNGHRRRRLRVGPQRRLPADRCDKDLFGRPNFKLSGLPNTRYLQRRARSRGRTFRWGPPQRQPTSPRLRPERRSTDGAQTWHPSGGGGRRPHRQSSRQPDPGHPRHCSVRRSSPPWPTSTPVTSPRTSPAARSFGYLLLWVIVAANLMAMLIQTLTAKLGWPPGVTSRRCAVSTSPVPVDLGCCGCRPRRWRWPPTSPRSSAARWRSTCFSACRSRSAGVISAVVAFASARRADPRVIARSRWSSPGCRRHRLGFGYTLIRSGADPAGMAAGMVPTFQGPTACCWRPASSARR